MRNQTNSKNDFHEELKELKLESDILKANIRMENIELTDRKRAEEDLINSETRYRRLFESAKDGILILEADTGKIIDVNPFLIELLGFSKEQFIGKELWEIGFFRDIAANYDKFLELQQKEYVRYEDLPLESTDGRKINVEFVSNVYIVNHKKVIQCNIRDITERKQNAAALVEAERLSAIGEMSAAVAHDFNNSLQVIIGNLEMALITPNNSSKLNEFLKASKRSASDAASRIKHMQRFTKKISTPEYAAQDLNELLAEVIIQTRPIWKDESEKKGIEIKFHTSYGEIVSIDGEYGELRILLHNIIKNAVEAMPKGGIITLKTGVIANNVYVRIADTGTGMDEETKKRIYQPFFSTKGFEGGRGFGLSGVYSIMRDHGGKISLQTTVGRGTEFELLFPFGKKQDQSLGIRTKNIHSISVKVLWVDDDEDLRDIEKEVMESMGHVVDVAASGKEAVEILEKKQYDLIITDVGMPAMNGWQMLEKITGKYKDMKIAMVSGWGFDISSEDIKKHGVSYVLEKPVTIDKLEKLIENIFYSEITPLR